MIAVKPSTLILSLIVSVWLFASAFAFWWFEYRYWGAYSEQLIIFDAEPIRKLYPILKKERLNVPLIVHFKDEDCPCDRYRVAHLELIAPMLEGTEQIVLSRHSTLLKGVHIPASPAVAIWDASGDLAYFGPYSSGMTCGKGFDFINMVLNKLALDENPKWINSQGFGCFCPW